MFVLGIAGPSGSGKTTLVRNVVKQLGNCISLLYDDYRPNYDKLTEDLEELRKGNSISYPKTGQQIVPTKYIIIEEPTGRTRKGMDDKIDYLVYINLPLEVSFTRVLMRSLEQSRDESINAFYETIGPQFEPKFSEKPTKLMHIMYWQLKMYLQEHRQLYQKDHQTHLEDADLIIDGMKTSEELVEEILIEFQNFIEKNEQKF
ncbi:MAG: uridine kinase family protein [Candidatus Thorarchaeota archaeon]|jgi:uridine kinase